MIFFVRRFFSLLANRYVNKAQRDYLRTLDQLQRLIFSAYIKGDYFAKQQQYENKMHRVRMKVLKAMQRIRCIVQDLEAHAMLEQGYETFLSLNSLLWRVSDHATFEVCKDEMSKISQSIAAVLLAITSPAYHLQIASTIEQLSLSIDCFEELYQSALQVVSYEPKVFLFFLQTLRRLREVLLAFAQRFLSCIY